MDENAEKLNFWQKIKKKWQSHVEKNKKIAAEKKLQHQKNLENIDDFLENFDPKKDRKNLTPALKKKNFGRGKNFCRRRNFDSRFDRAVVDENFVSRRGIK